MKALRNLPLRALISIAVLLFCFIAANWGYVYHEVYRAKDQAAEVAFLESDLQELSPPRLLAAGWPTKFYIRMEYADLPSLVQFSWENLALNIAVGCIGIGCILFYESRLHRARAKNAPGEKRRLSIGDLLVCTGLLASLLAYWRALELVTESEMAVSSEVSAARGTTIARVALPQPVARILPESMRWRIKRVSEVTLNEPNSELLVKVINLPYLTRLSIGGGDYDLKLLSGLASKPLLNQLRISGRQLDAETIASIAAIKQLQSLNLMRTNITAKALEALGDMPRLQSVNLIHTDVALAELGTPAWSKTVRTLRLPHPAAGKRDQLTIEGWPELRDLACNEYDERINSEPVTLELKQLPRLRKLSLDALQLFDLTLTGLPALVEITPLHSQWSTRASKTQVVPQDLWLRKLTAAGIPNVRSLKLFAPGIDAMHFSEPLDMQLELGATQLYSEAPNIHGARLAEIPGDEIQAMMKSWGDNAGPSELSFAGLPMNNVNLAPLAKCRGIRSLNFTDCKVTAEQLRQLRGIDGLEELNLDGCPVDGQAIAWLSTNLPDLRTLICEPLALRQLRLENNSKLQRILPRSTIPVLPIDALKIVKMPNLKESFDLPKELGYLHIEDAPSLTGMSTRGPWPEKAVFQGVRDLTFFAAGGERLDDAVAEIVLACEKLESLTLAYSNVSPAMLSKVGSLKNLTYLALSGSKVDDEVVAQWQALPTLRTLRLDDTTIADKTLEFLLRCEELEHLSLRNTAVTAEGLAQLSKLGKLSRIDCGGENWSADKMRAVCAIPSLTVIDLSDSTLTPEILTALQQNIPPKLNKLVLRNSEFDSAFLIKLAKENSELGFEADEADMDLNAWNVLARSERLAPLVIDESDTGRLLSAYAFADAMKRQGGSNASSVELANSNRAKGAVDPRLFAPDPLGSSGDSLSRFDPPAALAVSPPQQPSYAPPMSIPALIGYAIGNMSKTYSELRARGEKNVDEY